MSTAGRLGPWVLRALRRVSALFLCAGIAACAGAEFRVPDISDADVGRASLTVSSAGAVLPTWDRSDGEYRVMFRRIGERLQAAAPPVCSHAKAKSCHINLQYSNDGEVNAYATDNNLVVVHRALLQYLETEDEMAAVIGHEFGHHLAQHLEERRQNAAIGGLIAAVLATGAVIASGYQAPPDDPYAAQRTVGEYAKIGAGIGAITYSKEQEREADLLAAYLLERAGYDLRKAGRLFEVLSRLKAGKTRASLFDTHPAGPERMAAWEKTIAEVETSPDKLPIWSD